MRIVVLTKPVPDPASGGERIGADGRLDRTNSPAVVNGNDEYVLEKALKLVEAAGEGEVILLTMAPATAPETMRKALAMGATRGVLVTDPAIGGSCTVATTRILAAALKTLEFDLALAGVDTSDGGAHASWPDRFFSAIVDGHLAKANNRGASVGGAESYLISARALLDHALAVMKEVGSRSPRGRGSDP